ncbi:MAG: hypothetical protein ACXADY_10530 [Candidatus Hodarchaeales archaeon]
MSKIFRKKPKLSDVVNNSVILLICMIISFLSYFTPVRTYFTNLLTDVGVDNPVLKEILVIAIFALIIIIIYFILGWILGLIFEEKGKYYFESTVNISCSSDALGMRISDFEELRSKAKKSILIMGIGCTFLSKQLSILSKQLDKNISIRLLMIEPEIITSSSNKTLKDRNVIIKDKFIEDYFKTSGYPQDIKTSYNRLYNYIMSRKNIKYRKGEIKLSTYSSLISLNLTAIDEQDKFTNSELIVEFVLPFSDKRIRMKISEKDQPELHGHCLHSIEELWNQSNLIISDN